MYWRENVIFLFMKRLKNILWKSFQRKLKDSELFSFTPNLVSLHAFVVLVQTNGCGVPDELPDVNRRDPTYVAAENEPYVSDSTLSSSWYKAVSNGITYALSNGKTPSFAHCGTYFPVYLKGLTLLASV